MNRKRQKKTKSEIAVIISVIALFLALVVMLIGFYVAGDEEDDRLLAVPLAGIGLFVVSTVAVCVSSVLVRRGKKKQTEKVKAALPNNAVLLSDGTSAHFSDDGLRILRDSAFADLAPVIPYSELTIYCRCFRPSSRAKGKQTIFFMLPAKKGDFFAEEGGNDANMVIVGEEVLPLAQKYGVNIVDTRHPPQRKPVFKKKFSYRSPEQRKMALRWTFISVAAFAVVLGVCILISLNTKYSTSGLAGGLAAGIITPCVLSAARNWKKDVLKVYEEGVFLSSAMGKSFLFWEEIIKIDDSAEGIFFDCGGTLSGFPKLEGAAEYLREMHPEKFQERI